MKIIFLDIDGVLNSEDWYRKRHEEVPQHEQSAQYPFYELDPELVSNLNLIIQKTEAKVVVSSTWITGGDCIGKTVQDPEYQSSQFFSRGKVVMDVAKGEKCPLYGLQRK